MVFSDRCFSWSFMNVLDHTSGGVTRRFAGNKSGVTETLNFMDFERMAMAYLYHDDVYVDVVLYCRAGREGPMMYDELQRYPDEALMVVR